MTLRIGLLCLLIVLAAARKEIWIMYSNIPGEQQSILKYLHRIKEGFFVDLGGYNAIMNSNSLKLSTWNGIIVEANEKRAAALRDFQPNAQVLNLAISNVTGETVTLYQMPNDEVASTISLGAATGKSFVEQKTAVINLADLCHKYYKAKPTMMNIDVEGMGQVALKSNDWKNQKCIPDLIYAEDFIVNVRAGQPNLQPFLISNNYTKMDRVYGLNTIFIHNSKLDFYKKQAQANTDYITNKVSYSWQNQFSINILKNLIGSSSFESLYKASSHPAYLFFRQLELISIVELNKYSNFISTVGKNRPIIIMEYDQKISTIYLGTNDFTVSEKKIDKFTFIEIIANYKGENLKIYIFDHHKYDTFQVSILEENLKISPSLSQQKRINLMKSQIKKSIQTSQDSHNKNTENALKSVGGQIKGLINSKKPSVSSSSSSKWLLITILLTAIGILSAIILKQYYFKQRKERTAIKTGKKDQTSCIYIAQKDQFVK